MSLARVANPRVNSGVTSQGFYVAGADGTSYGFNNNRDPDRVLGFLREGKRHFELNPPKKVTIEEGAIDAPYARKPSEPASVVRVFSRISPMPTGADVLNHSVGRDHLWVYRSDIEGILGKTGRFEMPKALVARLVRFHLVDNVRGEPEFWTPSQVRAADFHMQPKGSGRYAFTGSFAMKTEDGARGLEGKMEGEMSVDPHTKLVTRFRAFADTTAWGAGPWTPRPPEGRFPIRFAWLDTDDEYSQVTPPQAASYGDGEYRSARLR
jgi:hypothetical protein